MCVCHKTTCRRPFSPSTVWGPGIELTSSVLVANKHLYQLNHIVGTPCWLIDNSDRLHAAAWVAASQVRARRVRTPLGYPASLPISYSLLSPQMFSAGLFSTLLCSPFRSLPRPKSPSLPPTINRLYIRSVAWLDCSGDHLGRARQVAPSRRIIPPLYKTPPALNM